MPAFVDMYRDNFKPGRMCDDPALLFYGQVRTEEGEVLARASRVYDQWFWTDPAGVSHKLPHPNNPWVDKDARAARHAELTRELIGHLVAIAKGYNESEKEKKQ